MVEDGSRFMKNSYNQKQEQIDHLNHEVVKLYNQGKYDQAIYISTQACEFARQHLGTDHPSFASCLDNLALLYKAMGNYSYAEKHMKQALEIRRKTLGENNHDFVTGLNNLAGLYKTTGRYTQAEPLYSKALDIVSKEIGENNEYFAGCLNNLASLYKSMGNYIASEPLYCKAKDIWSKTKGEKHPDFAIFLNNLADLYYLLGRYSEAEPLYSQALDITRIALGEKHPQFARSLNNLGSLYEAMGYYSDAEPHYYRACEILHEVFGEKHPEIASSLNNLAELHKIMGNYTEAERLYRQASEIWRDAFGEEHPNFITSLNNLADLYYSQGKFSASELLYQQALEILNKTHRGDHPDAATIMNNLAVLYKTKGRYVEAGSNYQQAMEIWSKTTGKKSINVALSLHNMAAMYQAVGNYGEAESYYSQALKIKREILGEEHPDIAISLNSLAALYMKNSRQNEAIALMKQAAIIDDHLVGQIFSISSESQRMMYLKTLRGNFNGFLSMVLHHPNHSSSVQAGLDLTLRRKAIGAEALAVQRDSVLGGKYPDLTQKLRELTEIRTQIAEKTLAGPGLEGSQIYRQLLEEWNSRKEQLEADLAHKIPEMNLELKLRAANRQLVASALPVNSVLVEFVLIDIFNFKAVPDESQWKPPHYLAFVLPAGKPEKIKMIDLGESECIDRMIARFRTYLTGEAEPLRVHRNMPRNIVPVQGRLDMVKLRREGNELRKLIFDPLIEAIGNRKKLFIAPDGDLSRLPFEVLPVREDRYLIDEFYISYLGVGRDVLRFGAIPTCQPSKSLVVADPNFDFGFDTKKEPLQSRATRTCGRHSRDLKYTNLHFVRLAGTRVEGERIACMIGVQPLLEDAVLEGHLKASRSPYIFHIATHGFFMPDQIYDINEAGGGMVEGPERFLGAGAENPLLRSGLALSGANTRLKGFMLPPEAEDGFLHAEDISGLNLLNTEMVVLSACETGLGDIKVGEGVFGLRRAFMLAGAKSLVMSLWKVPDQQTQELMVDFYCRILKGQPRAEALREAQIAIKEKNPEPYCWGAFICQGDPGPLTVDRLLL
jgi:CHAT domain-containing protein/tetratricopeptide (TPR) repeat protein